MFRITDFSGHCLGGEGGIKIKLTERRLRSMQNQNHFIVNIRHTVMGPDSNGAVEMSIIDLHTIRAFYDVL